MATDPDPVAPSGGATALHHDASDTSDSHDASDSHDSHDSHDEHGPAENPRWVLVPLVVGIVIAAIVIALLGLDSAAAPFT